MDTVPFDADDWHHDPFGGDMEGDRIYGLGTADMKSFLALAVDAARNLSVKNLRQPLIILATADEESSMAGAKALVDAGQPLGRYAVIGEPTSLRPVRMHKGMMMESIQLHGRSGHSSNPALGNNALEGMHAVLGSLLAMRSELQAEHRNSRFEVPYPTMNFGYIRGGDNPNRICAHCEMQIDLRPLPGMPLNELRNMLRKRLASAVGGSGLELSITPLFEGIEAMETPATSAIVQACEELTGYSAESVAFGTEGPHLNKLGMETIILGPGDISQAHKADESLAVTTLDPTVRLLHELIGRFCVEPKNRS
jgi:acetylornithine deacetylase